MLTELTSAARTTTDACVFVSAALAARDSALLCISTAADETMSTITLTFVSNSSASFFIIARCSDFFASFRDSFSIVSILIAAALNISSARARSPISSAKFV